MMKLGFLADELLFHRHRPGTPGRPLDAIAQLPDINLQFADRAAERVAVHPQFPRGTALIALVFLQNGKDETFFELAHTLRVKDVAAVHLQDECFQLIFH